MQYSINLMLLFLVGLSHSACLRQNGESEPQLISPEDTDFAGFNELGVGYDLRERTVSGNQVFNQDALNLDPRDRDIRRCGFMGSSEEARSEFGLDIGFGIDVRDQFNLDFRFGRNRTSTESTFTGYYGCVNYREVAVVSLDNSASTAQDLVTRNERNEFSDAQFFYDRYGTHYIERISFGAMYNVILQFTTTNRTLLDEWEVSLGFNATITEAIQISGDFQLVNRDTFSRTDTRIDLEESARGFLLQESTLAEGRGGFMDLLNNPDAISQRIQANTARFDETGNGLRNRTRTLFGRKFDVKTVASAINGANLVPVSFNLGEFDVIQELSINRLVGNQCDDLATNLQRARTARADLRSMLTELRIAEEDVLDSFGIDAATEQGRAYNRALQIVTTDIRRILSSMNDYHTRAPLYIAETDIESHSCGYSVGGRAELRSRFERLHDQSNSIGIESLSGCTFSGIVVDNRMRSLTSLFRQSGCPSDGPGGFFDGEKFFHLLEQQATNEELVVIGGRVQLTGSGDNDLVQGLRFDENRNAVGLGFIRGPIRDEIVSVDNVCEVIRVNDFVQTALGTAQVHDFSCVGTPSCLLNNRVDTREIRRQLANGRIEVELLSNQEFHFFSADEIGRISPPPSVSITFKPVIIRERLCTVNDKCGDGEGTCYRDAECETNMCHPGTFIHPEYIYPDTNEFLSFCVTFERKIARNRNECSPSALCNDGEGSCNSNADCQGNLQCQNARLNSAYDLRVNQVPSSQKICVRPTNPFDPANCRCCGRGRNSPKCDFTLQEGDGHCQDDNHCAGDLSCIPGTCGLFRSFPNVRNEFSSKDSCCVDVSGFQENSDVEGMDLLERVISGRHTECAGECIRRSECVYWVLNSENNGCYLFRETQNARVIQRNNRRGFPKVKYGKTPLGCPKGMVPTKGGHVNINLYGGRLQCVKKPADKLCGQGMKFTQRALDLQGTFDRFSVERDISVCRSMCRGCGAFRYNTDTSECSIFHGLNFILSDVHLSRPDEIVCVYDEEQAGERKVATNICLNPRSGRTTFPISTSGKILSATLVQRNGKIECLERRVLECPSHNTGNQGVFGTPDYCDCCLHGSSCNRCPRGFFHSGFRTACSGRGEFRCHAEGESHFPHSASFACDPSERAQVVLEGGSRSIRFDPVQTQSNNPVLTSVSGKPVEINSIMSIRYLEPSDPKFVFADGEVCFDVYMIIDDSQITESNGNEPMCYCDTPGAGTDFFNSLTCTNNEQHHCPSGQECFAPAGVPISQRGSACRAPLVAREEIQYHSTECGINDLSRHPVVCDDGYALQSWEMVSCNEGRAVNLIEDERRCIGQIWTDVFGTSAEDCAERLRNTNECRDQSVFQWAERNDGRCGCFTNTVRNCRYENGRTEDESTNVYEKFGFKVNYECVRINSKAKESRTSECQKPIGRPFLTTISNTGNESNLGLCEGECDNDGDCAPGLRCFQRNGFAPVPGCSGTGVEDFDYCYDPTTADARNVVEENPAGVGGWGGSCTCPDGSMYQVGDNNDHCGSLACIGGVGGTCNQFEGVWSHRKVTCAPAAPAEQAPAFECGENQVLQEFRVDTNSCEGGDVRYNYVCSTVAVSNQLGGVSTYPVAHHFEQNIGFVRCGSGDLLRGWSGNRNSVNAQCLQRGEGYEPVRHRQVACGWQLSVNGQASTVGGNSINCGRICDSRSDCASFTVCGNTCFFTSTDFSLSNVCTDDQGICTSYIQANFRLPE